jgi:hypothetical protein
MLSEVGDPVRSGEHTETDDRAASSPRAVRRCARVLLSAVSPASRVCRVVSCPACACARVCVTACGAGGAIDSECCAGGVGLWRGMPMFHLIHGL